MSSYLSAAQQVRRARVAQEQWNEEHPERFVAWEWLEEAILAWREWRSHLHEGGIAEAAEKAWLRHEEFARQLPAALLDEVFPR